MASSIPEQNRTVDPYASYNSNVVNQLTGIVTRGSDKLDIINSLQVISDSTSPTDHVNVLPGIVYKDDTLIQINQTFTVDFTDQQHYISYPIGAPPAGIYYIVLQYVYAKSRPAPQARIKILAPPQVPLFSGDSSLFFLKAIDINSSFDIISMYDYDPDNPSIKRIYVDNYAGTEVTLPVFTKERDQSRFVYASDEDEFYFGYSDQWSAIGAGSAGALFTANTLGFNVGDLVYVTNPLGLLSKAVGPYDFSTADGVVIEVAVDGKVQTSGKVTDIEPEMGITLDEGNLLYLSNSEPGKVTNIKTTPSWQFVGRCLSTGDSTGSAIIESLFVRGEPNGYGNAGVTISGVLDGTNWIDSPSTNTVYQNIDVSSFQDGKVIPTFWLSSNYMIQPTEFEYYSSTIVRVHMLLGFSEDVDYLLIGPSVQV